jgi:hypothetical protein
MKGDLLLCNLGTAGFILPDWFCDPIEGPSHFLSRVRTMVRI